MQICEHWYFKLFIFLVKLCHNVSHNVRIHVNCNGVFIYLTFTGILTVISVLLQNSIKHFKHVIKNCISQKCNIYLQKLFSVIIYIVIKVFDFVKFSIHLLGTIIQILRTENFFTFVEQLMKKSAIVVNET